MRLFDPDSRAFGYFDCLTAASVEALAHRFPGCWLVDVAEDRRANAHRSPDTKTRQIPRLAS